MTNEIQNTGEWLAKNRNNPAKRWATEVALTRLEAITQDTSLDSDTRHSAAEAMTAGLN